MEKIKAENVISPVTNTDQNYEWACQRRTRLEHYNKRFTDDLELLQTNAEFCNEKGRALAFRKASCVLKSLLFCVAHVEQLDGLKYIGPHVRKVIFEILDLGSSPEVEKIKFSDWFRKMKLFTSIFGADRAAALKWIERGWGSIADVRNAGHPSEDWRIVWGLALYEDLTTPVSRQEAEKLREILQREAQNILPGTIITLTGGFRRGKSDGQDINLLITHGTEGAEHGILSKLLDVLDKKDFILKGQRVENSFSMEALSEKSSSKIDHFESWFGICKLPKTFQHPTTPSTGQSSKEDPLERETDEPNVPSTKKFKLDDCSEKECVEIAKRQRDWLARRVDLIVTPYSQYYYALVGWTGSSHFNRDMRLYAEKVLNLLLTNHGLYDKTKQESRQATCEEDVFRHLNLTYRDPTDRNC